MQQKSNSLKKLSSSKLDCLKNIDMFGPSFEIEIEKGKKNLKTGNGAILTIILISIMIIYTYLRTNVFLSKSKMFIN